MLELLKKHGVSATLSSIIVLAITIVPLYYQYRFTKEQNARIAALEAKIAELEKK